MQLIAVDIGNSSTKIAVQDLDEDRDVRWYDQFTYRGDDQIDLQLTEVPAFWSICSVSTSRLATLESRIQSNRPKDRVHKIADSDVPLDSNIDSRSGAGRDRLVAAWMASQLADGPVVVVDAGTAVTIDFVDSEKVFQGGVIFPGAAACLKQISESAPALPDLSQREFAESLNEVLNSRLGKSTEPAIIGGVYQSQIAAITKIATDMTGESKCEIYATGGGVDDIQNHLPEHWNFVPDLVLRGAKSIGQRMMAEDTFENA